MEKLPQQNEKTRKSLSNILHIFPTILCIPWHATLFIQNKKRKRAKNINKISQIALQFCLQKSCNIVGHFLFAFSLSNSFPATYVDLNTFIMLRQHARLSATSCVQAMETGEGPMGQAGLVHQSPKIRTRIRRVCAPQTQTNCVCTLI